MCIMGKSLYSKAIPLIRSEATSALPVNKVAPVVNTQY